MSIASISIKLKIWENLSKVLQADTYSIQMKHSPSVAGKTKDNTKQRDIAKGDVLNEIPFLEKMNVNGYDILFTPVSDKYDYVILSGFDRGSLRKFREGACPLPSETPLRGSRKHPTIGFIPCVRTTPAPQMYQVILRAKKSDEFTLKKVIKEICSAYGVKWVKSIYFPGFYNHKSKTMTSTSSTSLRNISCKKLQKLLSKKESLH